MLLEVRHPSWMAANVTQRLSDTRVAVNIVKGMAALVGQALTARLAR